MIHYFRLKDKCFRIADKHGVLVLEKRIIYNNWAFLCGFEQFLSVNDR